MNHYLKRLELSLSADRELQRFVFNCLTNQISNVGYHQRKAISQYMSLCRESSERMNGEGN